MKSQVSTRRCGLIEVKTIKLNVFDFTVSRHRDGPDSFFRDYTTVRFWEIAGTDSARLPPNPLVRSCAPRATVTRVASSKTQRLSSRSSPVDELGIKSYSISRRRGEGACRTRNGCRCVSPNRKRSGKRCALELDSIDDRTDASRVAQERFTKGIELLAQSLDRVDALPR